MVNAIPVIQVYKCGKCHNDYHSRSEAEKCCLKKVDYDNISCFELKQIHLDLLKRFNIGWDECEYGAPRIDPKRPYGNSDVENDIAEIIGLPKKDKYCYDSEQWNEKTRDYIDDLHRQTQIALEIILHCQSFKLGKYEKTDFQKWKFIGG